MGAHDEVEVVTLQELGHDIGTKSVGHAPIVLSPAYDVLRTRVKPALSDTPRPSAQRPGTSIRMGGDCTQNTLR